MIPADLAYPGFRDSPAFEALRRYAVSHPRIAAAHARSQGYLGDWHADASRPAEVVAPAM